MKKSMEEYKIELENNVKNVEKSYASLESHELLPEDLKKQIDELNKKAKNVFAFFVNVASKGIQREQVLDKVKEEAYYLRKEFGGFFIATLKELPLNQQENTCFFRNIDDLNITILEKESNILNRSLENKLSDDVYLLFIDWKADIEDTIDCFENVYSEMKKQEYEISQFEKEKFELEIRHLEKKSSIL